MRTAAALAALATFVVASSVASSGAQAQPGNGPPPPPVYAPPPPPPPPPSYGGYPQAPAGLTADEQRILARGEIGPGEHFGGALLGFFIGFGSGQAVQGRWGDTGWIFTVGEAASIAAIVVGVSSEVEDCADDFCDDDENGPLIAIGVIGIIGFRVWEIVDSIAGPASHNRRLHQIQARIGYPQPGYYSVAPFVAPTHNGGGVAGLTFRF
jgi:hypothetical protein